MNDFITGPGGCEFNPDKSPKDLKVPSSFDEEDQGSKKIKISQNWVSSLALCKLAFLGTLLLHLPYRQPSSPLNPEHPIEVALKSMENLLEKLQKTNMSQSPSFANTLSKNWILVASYIENVKPIPKEGYLSKVASFIDLLYKYPENVDHSFGYYLSQLTGDNWLPFPFIDMLYFLHKESILKKEKSTLFQWIKKIKELIYYPN